VIDHVDGYSLRRTFATELITSGADPKSVQRLLGHKTLEMTRARTLAPEHLAGYPKADGISVQDGHQTVTGSGLKIAN
jgi:integrase